MSISTKCKECRRKVKSPRKYCWQHSPSSSIKSKKINHYNKHTRETTTSSKRGIETYIVKSSTQSGKKLMIITPSGKKVHFGQAGASDYTRHKTYDRMMNYLSRHAGNMKPKAKDVTTSRREKWDKNGLDTAGFWSRWLLWNLPSKESSARDIERRFGIKVQMK